MRLVFKVAIFIHNFKLVNVLILFPQDNMTSVQHEESEMADYAALIAMIYTMVRQDYMMQVTVVYFIVLHNYFSLPVI